MTHMESLSLRNQQFSIMHRIIDGTLRIDSIKEFEEILEIYPNDPLLYRKYADLLMEKQRQNEAVAAYERAAHLFVQEGMNLQAIVAMILHWSQKKPTHDQGRRFHALLHDKGARHTPLQRFWAQMSYAELVSVMLRLVRIRLSAGKKIIEPGDTAGDLFFVVSGSLMEILPEDRENLAAEQGIETEPILLGANDIFGDIYPLEEDTVARSQIRTVTEVELVKISKSVLRDTARKHPNVDNLLRSMHRTDSANICDRPWQTVRRARRYGLPARVELILPSSDGSRMDYIHSGIAVDLSINGICIDLGLHPNETGAARLKSHMFRLRLDLLDENGLLELTGKIVWHRQQQTDHGLTELIGIRFDSLEKSDRDLLMKYCAGSDGEQNLLWSLWHTMVRTDTHRNHNDNDR
jgi:hypothetical protein